jgi:hypothetical protein
MSPRRLARLLPSTAAIGLVVALALVLTPGASALCAPLLGPCGPSSGGGSPVTRIAAPSQLTSTSATLNGTVDPRGLATSYQFEYAPSAGGAIVATAPVALPASAGPISVSARTRGLRPGADYTEALVARNADGESEAVGSLRLPAAALLGLAGIGADHTSIRVGDSVTISARVSGRVARYEREYGTPLARLVSEPALAALTLPDVAEAPVGLGGRVRFLPVSPVRNTRFEVLLGSHRSRWLTVFVSPLVELYSGSPAGRRVTLTLSAGGGIRPGPSGPIAYFYRASGPGSPFQRIGAVPMRRSGYELRATLTRAVPPGSLFTACTRRQPIPGMGRPFLNRRCGRAHWR